MAEIADREATYQDLFALPENVVGEIIGGVLYTQPRPAGPHTVVASGLGFDLGGPFDRGRGGPGGWILLVEPELHLGRDILVPELAAWRSDRLSREALQQAFFTIAPDWVAEVASPSTTQRDRLLKVPLYAAYEVAHLWLVEPLDGRIEAYDRAGKSWTWIGSWADDAAAQIPPFDAVPLDLRLLWARSKA